MLYTKSMRIMIFHFSEFYTILHYHYSWNGIAKCALISHGSKHYRVITTISIVTQSAARHRWNVPFHGIILSAKKKEICRKFTRLIAFYARVHEIIFLIHSFVRSIDRLRIAMRYSLTAKCEDVGNDLSDRFPTSLQFSTALALLSSTEIIAGWMESGLNLFLRKLSHSRNLR